jgi:hypothetical protein
MHTVELLEEALALIARLGYQVRQESLAGGGGGGCELKGRKIFFLDLDLGPNERLDQALETLRRDPDVTRLSISPALSELLKGENHRQPDDGDPQIDTDESS